MHVVSSCPQFINSRRHTALQILRNEPPPSSDYVERVNRAIDFILNNLDQSLQLEDLARVACFSPFHFHRIFRALLGETLSDFVKRIRLERALRMLSFSPERTLTEISTTCGFASSSDFSRSFKQRYGVPPSAFDVETFRKQRRQDWQNAIGDPELQHLFDRLPVGENPDGFDAVVRDLPARRVAYIRVIDPYRPHVVMDATKRLVNWADEQGIDGQWYGYMWDDPEIVAHKDCRYDAAVEVGDDFQPSGEIGCFDFPEMKVAELEVRGAIDLEQRALDWLYRTWLPTSGYVPSEHPAFEAWIGRPFQHGIEHFELKVQIPIEPS